MRYIPPKESAMLLFDDSKALEKAVGLEAASVIVRIFEKTDEKWRQELATKADLQEARNDLIQRLAETNNRIAETNNRLSDTNNRMADLKHEILKWMFGIAIAQAALVIAVISFLK
jgi:serine phosphatase RsbU (regulator of sigma subunit)